MKKIKLSPILVAGMVAAIEINHDQAFAGSGSTVTFTNTSLYTHSIGFTAFTNTIPISPSIMNADELLSISSGSITGLEGGIFTLAVDYSNSTSQQIYTHTFNPGSQNLNFSSIPVESFALGDIDGLSFRVTSPAGGGTMTIPNGDVFTFEVTPEPTTLAMVALGAGGLWLAARRRASK